MNSLLLFLVRLLDFYTLSVFFYVVVSWLFHFNILNSQNSQEDENNNNNKYLPNLGGLDISPVLLILIIYLFKDLLIEYWPRG